MSLQLLIGRVDVPRASEQRSRMRSRGKHPLAVSSVVVLAPVPSGVPGSTYGMLLLGSAPWCWGGAEEVWGEEQQLPAGDEWLPINTCQGTRKKWVDYPPHSMR